MVTCTRCDKRDREPADELEFWLLDVIKQEKPDRIASDWGCPQCVEYYEALGDVDTLPEADGPL
ncbi:MAG: hypothetical protein AAGE01_14970 [Pseudomonadota bacterium]